jgi:acyl-CoA thioesterase
MPAVSLASASAVSPAGAGIFAAEIEPGWDIMGNANGGYLLATVARAGAVTAGKPDPVTVTGHFLAPGKPGPVVITTELVRSGRRFATVAATTSSDDRPLLTMLGTYSDLSAGPEGDDTVTHHLTGPPELPPPEECIAAEPTDTFPPPFTGKVDLRIHPDDVPIRQGPEDRMRIRGWLRLPGGEPIDPFGLVLGADSFPPAIFNGELPVGWTPTLELTVHVRARPADGWLAAQVTTRFVSDGFLEEDAEIWDRTGRLVAQSRQLALVPRG